MKFFSKAVAGLLATTALAFGVAAYADMGPACEHDGPGMMGKRGGDPAARVERHLSQFKSELKITPAQEPQWQAFADKLKAEMGQGKAMRGKAQEPMPMAAPERMTRMLEMKKAHLASMESVAASFKTLYETLTPEQKAIADKHGMFGRRMGPGGPGGKPPRGQGGPGGQGGPAENKR